MTEDSAGEGVRAFDYGLIALGLITITQAPQAPNTDIAAMMIVIGAIPLSLGGIRTFERIRRGL